MPGVKGLAAMFEQRGDTSPDDLARGRSPNGLPGTPPLSDSPRPLSKIRTQFVAVEKDGRLGLTRGISTESITSPIRRLNNETGATTPQARHEPTSDPFSETAAALRKITSNPTSNPTPTPQFSPESPQKLSAPFGTMSPSKPAGPGTPELMPNANPDKVTDEEETKTKLQPGLPTVKTATRAPNSVVTNGIGDTLTSAAIRPPTPELVTAPAAAKLDAPAKIKPAPVSTGKTANKPPKSPQPAKAPKSPLPPKAPKSPAKDTLKMPSLAPAKKISSTNLKDSAKKTVVPAAAPASATTASKKPATLEPLRSGATSSVKPKSKSPTRPVKLPSGLTSQTTSSSSRTAVGTAPPVTKQPVPTKRSRSLAPSDSSRRPASRISTAGGADAPRTLRRKSSSVNGSRQSVGHIGPPPKPKDQAAPKKEYHVDESFLARMMRPTQSSASKTTEKAPVTPPRKPSSSKAPSKHMVGADVTASAKKAAARIQASGSTKSKGNDSTSTKSASPVALAAERIDSRKPNTGVSKTKVAAQPATEPAAPADAATAVLVKKMDDLTIVGKSNNSVETEKRQVVAEQAIIEPIEPEQRPDDKPLFAVTDEPLKVEDIEDVVHEASPDSAPEKVEVPETVASCEDAPATPTATESEVKADSEAKEDSEKAVSADAAI